MAEVKFADKTSYQDAIRVNYGRKYRLTMLPDDATVGLKHSLEIIKEVYRKELLDECYWIRVSLTAGSVARGDYVISFTHTEKLRERKISTEDIEEAIRNGMLIEDYPDDPRGPSCLILGRSGGRALHVVCGQLDEKQILIITAYEPDPAEWESDWRTRRR